MSKMQPFAISAMLSILSAQAFAVPLAPGIAHHPIRYKPDVVRGIKPRINGAGLWCNLVQPKLGSKNA